MSGPGPLRYAEVLAAVTAAADYLTVVVHPPAGGGWIGCDELIGNGEVREAALDASRFGTDDAGVRASLFCQGHAFRVASVVLAPFALGLPAPRAMPGNVAVRVGEFGVRAVAVRDDRLYARDVGTLADELLIGHLARLITSLRTDVTIGERLLWGNVASACARVVCAVEGAQHMDRAAVRARGEQLMAHSSLAGLGSFQQLDAGWTWTRTTCCLWYQCAEGSWCDDCSLIRERTPLR